MFQVDASIGCEIEGEDICLHLTAVFWFVSLFFLMHVQEISDSEMI